MNRLTRSSLAIALIGLAALNLSPLHAQTPAERKLLDTERQLAQKAAAEEEAQRQREEAEERRREAEKDAAERKRDRERRCVIRPVMSDAEIATCKEVWR